MREGDRLVLDIVDAIDGIATADQKKRIQQALAADSSLGDVYREMQEVDEILRRIPPEPVPPELKTAILEAVSRRVTEPAASPGWWTGLGALFAARPALRYGYVFAGGLAAGILLMALVPGLQMAGPGNSDQRVTGTMIPDAGPRGAGSRTIELGGGRVTVRTLPAGEGRDLRLVIQAPRTLELTLGGLAAADSSIRLRVQSADSVRQEEISLE